MIFFCNCSNPCMEWAQEKKKKITETKNARPIKSMITVCDEMEAHIMSNVLWKSVHVSSSCFIRNTYYVQRITSAYEIPFDYKTIIPVVLSLILHANQKPICRVLHISTISSYQIMMRRQWQRQYVFNEHGMRLPLHTHTSIHK